MLVADLESMLDYMKNAPLCDGNHEWVDDEENEGNQYCAKCFVVKEQE